MLKKNGLRNYMSPTSFASKKHPLNKTVLVFV